MSSASTYPAHLESMQLPHCNLALHNSLFYRDMSPLFWSERVSCDLFAFHRTAGHIPFCGPRGVADKLEEVTEHFYHGVVISVCCHICQRSVLLSFMSGMRGAHCLIVTTIFIFALNRPSLLLLPTTKCAALR